MGLLCCTVRVQLYDFSMPLSIAYRLYLGERAIGPSCPLLTPIGGVVAEGLQSKAWSRRGSCLFGLGCTGSCGVVASTPSRVWPSDSRNVAFGLRGRPDSYLVDPASSHMLVSKTKPCMSKYKCFCTVKLRMAH